MIVAQVKAGADIEPVKQAMIAPWSPSAPRRRRPRSGTPASRERNNFETLQNNPQQMAVAMSNAIARVTGGWCSSSATWSSAWAVPTSLRPPAVLPPRQPHRRPVPAGRSSAARRGAAAPSVEALLAQYQPRPAIASGEAFDPAPGNIEQRTTRIARTAAHTALKLALLPKKSRGQTVSVSMNLEFGDAQGLFGQRAVAQLTAAMLMRGTEIWIVASWPMNSRA
jgi:zinc protease